MSDIFFIEHHNDVLYADRSSLLIMNKAYSLNVERFFIKNNKIIMKKEKMST